MNLRKQLVLWLVNLPKQNLLDHMSSECGLHNRNWDVDASAENGSNL
ncbi:unnamed protein product [Trichobilharzia regenti]|nr:unnamed protein product [Trichobilharzia regenti]